MKLLLLLLALPAFAAVNGLVINGTLGKPQPGAAISLVQPGQQGMQTLGTTTSAGDGTFAFDATPTGPVLLQATHKGVTYSALVQPNQPKTGVQVLVYESSAKRDGVEIDRHGILFEPLENKLVVREFIFIDNKSKQTYNDDANGTYRFYLPSDAEQLKVSVTPPSGMALTRSASKTAEKNVQKISFPIRPGQTQFELEYALPLKDPIEFSGNILHADGATRLIVPKGFALEGKDLEKFAPEPTTMSPIYGIKSGPFTVKMIGRAAPPEPVDEDSGSPPVKAHRPRLYDRFYWVLGLGLAIMVLSLLALGTRTTSAKKK